MDRNMNEKRVTVFCKLSLVLLAWLFLHTLYMTWDGMRLFDGTADVAIVLGNKVLDDGSLSPWLRDRVDEALRLYRNRQVKKIFVSGGIDPLNGRKEGDAMKQYLVNQGVPAIAIVADNFGRNTYYTAIDFMQLNKREHFQSAVVVSSFYHITRSKYILKKQGFTRVYGSGARVIVLGDWMGLVRDWAAIYKYAIVY
jgi:vancomycin permeability regulator SanA